MKIPHRFIQGRHPIAASWIFPFILLLAWVQFAPNSVFGAEPGQDNNAESSSPPLFETEMAVGIIDITAGSTYVSGNVEQVSEADGYPKTLYVDGRVAFYLKGKIKGKYLLTTQMDTGEGSLGGMLDRLGETSPGKIFDKIDPDKYYPVYGDDSTLVNDTESQGRFYIRLDWDKSKALWGNYQISLNEEDLAKYHRSLYGFTLDLKNPATVGKENPTGTKLFWAKALTIHSRDVIKPTGGSLYYLRNANVVIGSEQIAVEIRSAISGELIRSVPLVYGRDYDISYLQGRLILKRSLESVVMSGLITTEAPIDGNTVFLIADYEYDASRDGFKNSSYGLETSRYLTDALRVGGSFAKESAPSGQDYQYYGINYQLKLGMGTVLSGEWLQSENGLANRFYSEDGGLTYTDFPTGESTRGDAWEVGLNTVFPRAFENGSPFKLTANYVFREKGFSTSDSQILNATRDYGLELSGDLAQNYALMLKLNVSDEESAKSSSTALLQLREMYQKLAFTEEVKYQQVDILGLSYQNTLGAVRVDYSLNDSVNIYGIQQLTLGRSDITWTNNRSTLGADMALTGKWNINLEGSSGDLGDSLVLGTKYQYNADYQVYGKVESATDQYNGETIRTTLGNKGKVGENLDVYTENQFESGTYEDGVSQLYGLDFSPSMNWTLSVGYTQGKVDKKAERPVSDGYPFSGIAVGVSGMVDRTVYSLGIMHQTADIIYKTRLQYRQDEGTNAITQYVTTNLFKWKQSDALSYSFKLNYSLTVNPMSAEDLARYVEASIGFAYRPVENDRFNLIGEYTYLEDLSPVAQQDGTRPGERSHVFSIDGIYDLTKRWQLGEKIAYKRMEIMLDEGAWQQNDIYLWVNRLNYHLLFKWDVYLEYRMLWDRLSADEKSGFLLAAYYQVNENMKLGLGYNFTDFNDDLTHLDYNAGGWFINMIKSW